MCWDGKKCELKATHMSDNYHIASSNGPCKSWPQITAAAAAGAACAARARLSTEQTTMRKPVTSAAERSRMLSA